MEANDDAAMAGVTVLEVTDGFGLHAGKLLADMGAEVIKIERPGGDPTRRVGPFLDDEPHPDRSLYFWHYNTSKKGITLDLDCVDGQRLFRELVRRADVVIEEKSPDYMDERGLSYEALEALNPRLVVARITPFGPDGPWRDYKTSDLVAMALGGPVYSSGYDDSTLAPIRPGGGQAGNTASHFAVIGILGALFEREASGRGQLVDCSVHASLAATVEFANVYWIYLQQTLRRQTGRHAWPDFTPPTQHETRDGRYINAMGLQRVLGLRSDANWDRFVEWLDSCGMAENLNEYGDATVRMREDVEWTIADIAAKFCATRTAEELYHEGQARGMHWGIVRQPEENITDPHFVARDFPVAVEHAELKRTFVYPGAPFKCSETPWRIRRRAPLVGEDNEAVYCTMLGLSREDLNLLAEMNVI